MSAAQIPISEATQPLFLGIDVGGTNIKLGIVDSDGRVVAQTSIPTQEHLGPQHAAQEIRQAALQLCRDLGIGLHHLVRAGLATPGTMDIPQGTLLQPHNLPHWHNSPIRDLVASALDLQVSYANDANAAAYGEFWVGSGRELRSIIMLTLGTGVGGGVIIGNLSVDGENSTGSECGHITIDSSPDARPCGCGQKGHLEAYCSATALVKRAQERLAAGANSSLRFPLATGEPLTALHISQHADGGDPLALQLIEELGTYLGQGICSLMAVIDPGAVILGGAMNFGGESSPLGRRFLEHVRQVVREHTFPVLARRTKIEFARLAGDAGFIGAAGIARLDYKGSRSLVG